MSDILQIRADPPWPDFIFTSEKGEMLRIAKDGFYVEGEKIEDKYQVYERFNEWLSGVEHVKSPTLSFRS